MNKILKNILLTICIMIANVWHFMIFNLANYGLFRAIDTFPEKCTPDLPDFCIGTPWYNQLNTLGWIIIYYEILVIVISIIYLIRLWKIDSAIYKLGLNLWSKIQHTQLH